MVMNHQQQNMVHFNPQQQVQTNVAINVQDPVSTEIAFQALSNANQVAQQAQSQLLQAQHTVHQIEQQAQMQNYEARQYAEQVTAQAEQHVAQRTHLVETAAQQQIADLTERVSRTLSIEQTLMQEQARFQQEQLASEAEALNTHLAEARSDHERLSERLHAATCEVMEKDLELQASRRTLAFNLQASPIPAAQPSTSAAPFTPPARVPMFNSPTHAPQTFPTYGGVPNFPISILRLRHHSLAQLLVRILFFKYFKVCVKQCPVWRLKFQHGMNLRLQ